MVINCSFTEVRMYRRLPMLESPNALSSPLFDVQRSILTVEPTRFGKWRECRSLFVRAELHVPELRISQMFYRFAVSCKIPEWIRTPDPNSSRARHALFGCVLVLRLASLFSPNFLSPRAGASIKFADLRRQVVFIVVPSRSDVI
jgi:hypothetical protein